MTLEAHLEGVLFYAGRPLLIKELAAATGSKVEEVTTALTALRTALEGRGITLLVENDEATLMTSAELAPTIEAMRKEELQRDIGKAGAETLAIITYLGNATRAEIDFIRGVNSTFILRNLMIRGLIERTENLSDRRAFAYRPTLELFAHLGISRKEDLPHYAEMLEEIKSYRADAEARASDEAEETHI